MLKRIYILFAALVFSVNLAAQYNPNYRNVFWMHGLQGDANSMIALSDYFQAKYKINSFHPAYLTSRGIVYAGNQLNSFNFEQPNDFVVAHSMGGVVARQYDRQQAVSTSKFGGLITLNSPHQGAEFASSFDNGNIQQLFNITVANGLEGYNVMGLKVGEAQYHEAVLTQLGLLENYRDIRNNINIISGIASYFIGTPLVFLATNYLANLATTEAFQLAINSGIKANLQMAVGLASATVFGSLENPELYPNAKDDLKPNSIILNTLNQTPLPCPKIAIAGVEDYPAGIKFLGSTLSYMGQSNPGIGDIKDDVFLNFTKAIASDSRKCENRYYWLAIDWGWFGLYSHYREKSYAFARQARFWENGFEREYQKCLGGIHITTGPVTHYVLQWVCPGPEPAPSQPIIIDTRLSCPPNDCWKWVQVTITGTVEKIYPNDGIVNEQSQKGLAGAILPPTITGTNHEEAKRSVKVKEYLESQFELEGSFFKLERK
jgi:pimeloyl-ACP methyl ester carboxylesterase